jgi:hypothetical protein
MSVAHRWRPPFGLSLVTLAAALSASPAHAAVAPLRSGDCLVRVTLPGDANVSTARLLLVERLPGQQAEGIGRESLQDVRRRGNLFAIPWYSTFFENRSIKELRNIGILKLSKAQVNLSSSLMAWTVVTSKNTIADAFKRQP